MTLSLAGGPRLRTYLVATDVHSEAFAPMIVVARSKRQAAKKAAKIWTGADTLVVTRLRHFEEFTIARRQIVSASATKVIHEASSGAIREPIA